MKKKIIFILIGAIILTSTTFCQQKDTKSSIPQEFISSSKDIPINILTNCSYDQAVDLIFLIPEVQTLEKEIRDVTNKKRGVSILDDDPNKHNSQYYEMKVGDNNELRFQTYFRFTVKKSNCDIYFINNDDQEIPLNKWNEINNIQKYYKSKTDSIKYISYLKNHYNTSNSTQNFEGVYNSLNVVQLPLKYSFDFIVEEPNFISVPQSYRMLFNLDNLDNYAGIRLPLFNKTIKPILISAYDITGQSAMFLYILSEDYKVLDKLKLYYSYDIDRGNIVTVYDITKDYYINIQKIEYEKDSEKIIETKNYILNKSGKFEEVK